MVIWSLDLNTIKITRAVAGETHLASHREGSEEMFPIGVGFHWSLCALMPETWRNSSITWARRYPSGAKRDSYLKLHTKGFIIGYTNIFPQEKSTVGDIRSFIIYFRKYEHIQLLSIYELKIYYMSLTACSTWHYELLFQPLAPQYRDLNSAEGTSG